MHLFPRSARHAFNELNSLHVFYQDQLECEPVIRMTQSKLCKPTVLAKGSTESSAKNGTSPLFFAGCQPDIASSGVTMCVTRHTVLTSHAATGNNLTHSEPIAEKNGLFSPLNWCSVCEIDYETRSHRCGGGAGPSKSLTSSAPVTNHKESMSWYVLARYKRLILDSKIFPSNIS